MAAPAVARSGGKGTQQQASRHATTGSTERPRVLASKAPDHSVSLIRRVWENAGVTTAVVLCPQFIASGALIAALLTSDQSLGANMLVLTDRPGEVNSRFGEDLDDAYYAPMASGEIGETERDGALVFVDDADAFSRRNARSHRSKYVIVHRRSLLTKQIDRIALYYSPSLASSCPELSFDVVATRLLDGQTVMCEEGRRRDCDVGQGGWMTRDILYRLPETCPKLLGLLTQLLIRSSPNERNVIHCSACHVDLIDTLLIYAGVEHLVVSSTRTASEDVRSIVKAVNQGLCTLLVCDACPSSRLENISGLHLLDPITIDVLESFIDRMYSREQYWDVPHVSLSVLFHMSVSRSNAAHRSSDEIAYETLFDRLREKRALDKELWTKSEPLYANMCV